MGSQNDNRDAADRLCSILENLDGTPAENLGVILNNLNPNAEAAEQAFVDRLRLMRRDLESTEGAELAAAQVAPKKDEAALRGLISEARKRGLTTAEFADAAQLSTTLVTKLDLRRIHYPSIPRQVIEDVAGAIKRSAEQVAQYLQGGPIRTAVVFSDADVPEDSQESQDFLDVVRGDVTLSEGRRARLLEIGSQ